MCQFGILICGSLFLVTFLDQGWRIQAYECRTETFTSPSGIIRSPNHPDVYPHDVICHFEIEGNENDVIEIAFTTFHTERPCKGVMKDYLKITDGRNGDNVQMVYLTGALKMPYNFVSQTSSVSLDFVSDSSISYSGFKAEFFAYGSVKKCGTSRLNDLVGELKTPGFPHFKYPNNVICDYVIKPKKGYYVEITFDVFELEASKNGKKTDYLRIQDGRITDKNKSIHYFNGTETIPFKFIAKTTRIIIRFASNSETRKRGFHALYKQIKIYEPVYCTRLSVLDGSGNCTEAGEKGLYSECIVICDTHYDLRGNETTQCNNGRYIDRPKCIPNPQFAEICAKNISDPDCPFLPSVLAEYYLEYALPRPVDRETADVLTSLFDEIGNVLETIESTPLVLITVEPPQGLRANLMSSFAAAGTGEVTKELFDTGGKHLVRPGVIVDAEELDRKNEAWKKLVFALCFFNAVVHERKKYDALGFNLPYEFTSSDLEVSLLMLQQLLIDSDDIPWPALRYLTGEVVYGGRVTDQWDRRCLDSTLQKFYCEKLQDKDYTYSEDGIYKPVDGNITFVQVQEYLEQLPLVDSPDVFGMHDNAERAHLELEAKRIIDVVIDVQPRLATAKLIGSGRTNDEVVTDLIKDIQRQLPITVEIEDAVLDDIEGGGGGKQEDEIKMTLAKMMGSHIWNSLITKATQELKDGEWYHPLIHSALLTVLRQEIDRFDRLLRVIHINLRALTRAIRGEIVMSEALEKTHASLLMHKVPSQWQDAAYESCKMLGSWVADLTCRIDFFARWSDLVIHAVEIKVGIGLATGGPTPASQRSKSQTSAEERKLSTASPTEDELLHEPKSFWLSAFFFPQGFLTAVLQNYARKYLISVDSLAFQFHVYDVTTDDDIIDAKKKLQVLDLAFGNSTTGSVDDGVKVFGLYLDGARWDPENRILVDSQPGVRHFRMPEIHFLPVPSVQKDEASGKATPHADEISTQERTESALTKQDDLLDHSIGHLYECPLYRTSTRAGTLSSTGHSTNFVSAVFLPSYVPQDHWILRGAALLCQLDE